MFVLLSIFTSLQSYALVDMRNANYSNSWVDLEAPGVGYDMKVMRSYNSRTLFNGMFGFGWCSDFETTLSTTPEGNIKISECGAGTDIFFSPSEMSTNDIQKTISNIVSKMKAEKKVGLTEAYFKSLASDLMNDDVKRADLAKKYGVSAAVKEGTKFLANGKEVENIVLAKNYYTRTLSDGTAQRFDMQGHLIALYDKNGNYLKLDYEKDLLKEISDNNNRRLSFKFYPNKKVKSITGPNGLTVEYKFDNLDDLSYVKNAWKNVHTYQYDDLHNLTKATWPNKQSVSLTYDKKKDWVISFTDFDKCVENYAYEFDNKDPDNHYWATVKKSCGKKETASNRYEFWHKQRGDGQYYLSRVLFNVNGLTTDISYHELTGKPVSIRKNDLRITFDYYPDGLVKTKSAPGVVQSFEWDKEIKKISQVTTTFKDDKGKVAGTKSSQFQYDSKGNLVAAQNTDGQKINMTYDPRGRISSITDQAKKIVKIDYEENFGKPQIVTRPGLGSIKVSYKSTGEIMNVESKEGPSVAMQVASTFNNLLDVIAPATAELYN